MSSKRVEEITDKEMAKWLYKRITIDPIIVRAILKKIDQPLKEDILEKNYVENYF